MTLGRVGLVGLVGRVGRVGLVGMVAVVAAIAAGTWVRVGPLPERLLPPNLRPSGQPPSLLATSVPAGDLRPRQEPPSPPAGTEVGSTQVVDRHGELLYEARADDGTRATWLDAAVLPQALVDATIAAEDHRFFRHPGIDPISSTRAALRNLRYRRVLEGGSTITQQVAKLLLARRPVRRSAEREGGSAEREGGARIAAPGSRRSVLAKLREAVIALRLEHRLTKREILALYLNLAPYGNQLTGAERASQAYFGQPASLLTPAQAAFLAALPQRPASFNPYRDATRARRRQQHVIAQMGALGMLGPDRVREAMDERLALGREPAVFVARHFVERVLALSGGVAGEARPGRIQTTLDAELQREVEGIIRAERPGLERHGAHNVAAVVLDNATGEWLAWEGSGDYADARHGGAIDGAVAPRQPGSALKPFTYALAFERGASPATVLPDVASYFPTAQDGVLYSPRNYDGQFRGPLLARHALASSQNVPAVALASRVGVPSLLRFLRAAGFSTFDKTAAYYGLGVTLGDAEVRLAEIVPAYAAFARGGVAVQPVFVRGQPSQEIRLVSPRTAFWISNILSDDDARAHAFGRGGSLEFPFAVAAKTGTSQAYRDNWAIGYTRAVTVGVWVGNFDRRPLIGSSGVTGAGPIFHAIMLAAMRHVAGALPSPDEAGTLAQPEGTARRSVCALSGMAATPSCPSIVDEWLPADAAVDGCSWHRPTGRGVVIDWPAEYRAWAASERLLDRVVAREHSVRGQVPACEQIGTCPPVTRLPHARRAELRDDQLRIVSPPDGAVYLIDPTLRREFQTIALRAASPASARIEWRVDGAPVGTSEGGGGLDWPLAVGRHVIIARDPRGMTARAAIVVK